MQADHGGHRPCRRLVHSARHAGIALVNQLTDRSAVACADKELAQVFDILLDNAIRYAGRGATVTLRAVTDPDTAQLIVEDDGPGLSAEERIWAPRRFWRAPQHSDSGGTGLGLAIAVQLLAARHGSLHLMASERGGLAARITLPRAGHPERDR